jgi:CHAT domain-containing protein/predicted negative regulator of RcsB-dependent stress response
MVNKMNSLKIQYKALIFKSCPLLLVLVFLNLSSIAQSFADTNDAKHLYDNSRVLYSVGDFDKAIKDLNEILLLKNKMHVDTEPEYFKVYNRLGLVYRIQGNLQKAIEYYRYALENTTDEYYIKLINDNIANIYSLTGDYAKAINYFENSLSVLEKSKKERKIFGIINNYHNQGHAYYRSGQMKLALEKSLKGIQIAEENQISVGGLRYNNCALIYQNLDSTDQANYYYKKAVESSEKEYGNEHFKTALAYMYYGSSFCDLANYEAGVQLHQKSLKILLNNLGHKHPFTSLCFKHTGNLYYRTKNYKLALSYYQKSLISKINNFNDSSIYANPSSNVFPDLDLLDVLKGKAQALEMLATQENKESNLKATLSTLELTVGFIEQLRMGYLYENSKLVLAEKEYESYMSIIKIAYELLNITGDKDYIHVAFKYSERSKYAILRESINEESARNFASIPDSLQKHMQGIKEQIGFIRLQIENENKLVNPDSLKQVELKEKLFRLTQSREKTVKELEQNYPKYYKRKYENSVVSISELQATLVQKEAVISYELTDSTLYTFVITKDKYDLLRNPVDSAFYKNLKSYSNFLHSEYLTSYNYFRIPSYELYRKLIEPTLSYIEGKNLLIIPNSELSLISFESLTTEPYIESEYAYYKREPYLLRKYPIGYSYSATLYSNSKHRKKKWNPNFLGFAPDYKNSRDTLQYLPTVSKNIKRISRLMRSKIFTKEDATEQNFKKHVGSYGILHLYAHGNEDLENPQFSKMYFSYKNDSVEDGYLYAYEVEELNFNAELVVLASCFSGSGAVKKGEGVISIGRSFMNSETQALITSLWLAAYQPTLFELKIFYRHLLRGKRKDEALRLAKLKYLDSAKELQSHPKYWNSLVIIGNQDPIFKGYLIRVLILPVILFFILILVFFKIRKRRNKR